MFALGPLRPLRGSRAPSCDFASQSSSLRSSGDLTASPQVHLALRQPDACRRGRMTRDHETLPACRAAFRRLKGRGSALARRSLGCFILQPRSLRGNDLRHAPQRPFGLRPTTSRSVTKTAFAVHENARFAGFTKKAWGACVSVHESSQNQSHQ